MNTAKVDRSALGNAKNAQAKTRQPAGNNFPRLRGLQAKLIYPYLLLTLAIAMVGVFISTVLVVDSENERLSNSLLDASRTANDVIVQKERVQLDRLRLLVFIEGMAQAMFDSDSQYIGELMRPLLTGDQVDLAAAIAVDGRDIITLGKNPESNQYHIQQGVTFTGLASVRAVLEGASDDQGDKFVELVPLDQGVILFTAAPVRDSNSKLAGAMLVGSYLDNMLLNIKKQSLADVVVINSSGQPVATTLPVSEEGNAELARLAAGMDPAAKTRPMDVTLNGRPSQVAYSPLIIRGQQAGWIGVVRYSDYQVSPAAQSRLMLIALFALGAIAVVVMGYVLAQNIALPILKLRSLSQAVAAGDLNQNSQLTRSDEIGELAEAFDKMTLNLRDRTEEARRLYEETLQRNKELALINARLEAAQLQLIQSEKLASIGQLTAGIVHDVKNPFAVIMGMAEVLGEDEHLDDETRHGLKVIRESAVKGNNIVSDLLKFARQSKPEVRPEDLRETIESAMRMTAYLTRRYNTTIDLPKVPVVVQYDAQQVEQVLINMLHNAVQAMPDGGSLRVALKRADGFAEVSVSDSGQGIAPENLKRIFDPFFTTKAEGDGTGLGLSVSYGIIANHRGRILVDSAMGAGTTFTIQLPLDPSTNLEGETAA
jgi:signal transduction histidine kinase